MVLGFDTREVGPVAALAAIFVLRFFFSPAKLVRRFVPQGAPRRTWRDWTWPERITVGLMIALMLWGISAIHGANLASDVAAIALVAIVFAIKGLLSQHRRKQ